VSREEFRKMVDNLPPLEPSLQNLVEQESLKWIFDIQRMIIFDNV